MPTKFTDGKRTITLEMQKYDPQMGQALPDWSSDFCDTGLLDLNENDVYIVDNIDDLIEAALDWKYGAGEFQEETPVDPGFRFVYVDGFYLTRHNEVRLDPITHRPLRRYENEMMSAQASLNFIRAMCETLSRVCKNIPDKADPHHVSKMLTGIHRAESALSFANNTRWEHV